MTTLKDKIRDVVISALKDVGDGYHSPLGLGDQNGMIHVDRAVDAFKAISEDLVDSIVAEIKEYFNMITV